MHFIDCGENLEEIVCPSCNAHLRIDNWRENDPVMAWWSTVFYDVPLLEEANCLDVRPDDVVQMLCCSQKVRVLDLRFDWPAAFGRCELSVMNPNTSPPLDHHILSSIQASMGCELYEIWAHY